MHQQNFVIFIILVFSTTGCGCTALKIDENDWLENSLPLNSSSVISNKKYLSLLNKALDFNNILNVNPNLMETLNSTKVCFNAMVDVFKNRHDEIFSYFDASGKLSAGIALGNVQMWGSFEECQSIQDAHYCMMCNIVLMKKYPTALGLCVPDVCDADSLTAILTVVANYTTFGNFSLFNVYDNPLAKLQYGKDAACYEKEVTYSNGATVMLCISSLIALLCFVGTVTDIVYGYVEKCQSRKYELYVNDDIDALLVGDGADQVDKKTEANQVSMHLVSIRKGNIFVNILICFSIIKNTRALFDTHVPTGAITSINGIRVLSITWVILGHGFTFGITTYDNVLTLFGWLPRFTMQVILQGTLSVDTFFFLSGLLVSYLSMKRYNTMGKLPLLRYYLHRYIRLTPSYAFCIFFYTYLYPILSDGPFWFTQDSNSIAPKNCISNWWTNLLYINNLVKEINETCFGWGWYLANDMQFYIISPIILWCMFKFKWIGVAAVNGVLLVACFISNAVLIDEHDASPIFYDGKQVAVTQVTPSARYMLFIYEKPWARISPYLVGIVLGYILINKKAISHNKYIFYTLGWLGAIGMGLAVVYGPYSVTDHHWTEVDVQFFGVLFRFVWAIAVGWVVFACHNHFGGLVNDFLSWKAFIPLSRLTYAVYLIHPMVIFIFFFSTKTPFDMSILLFVYVYASLVVISFMVAYVVSVCIEYPVFNLEKLFLNF